MSGALNLDTHEDGSFGTGAFFLDVASLDPGATYYFRAYATNPVGTSYGSELSFKTTSQQAVGGGAVGMAGTLSTYAFIKKYQNAGGGSLGMAGTLSITDLREWRAFALRQRSFFLARLRNTSFMKGRIHFNKRGI